MVSDSDTEEEHSSMEEPPSMGGMGTMTEAPPEITEPVAETKAQTRKSSGRRAALRIVRENVERVSKDLGNFRKAGDASSKRIEKQLGALRSDIAALKSHIAKETARARSKQDAALSRLVSRLSAAKSKTKRAVKKKTSKSKKSKGKK